MPIKCHRTSRATDSRTTRSTPCLLTSTNQMWARFQQLQTVEVIRTRNCLLTCTNQMWAGLLELQTVEVPRRSKPGNVWSVQRQAAGLLFFPPFKIVQKFVTKILITKTFVQNLTYIEKVVKINRMSAHLYTVPRLHLATQKWPRPPTFEETVFQQATIILNRVRKEPWLPFLGSCSIINICKFRRHIRNAWQLPKTQIASIYNNKKHQNDQVIKVLSEIEWKEIHTCPLYSMPIFLALNSL